MTPADARFIRDVEQTLRALALPRLYWLSIYLAEELERRGLDCAPEARALQLAMLNAVRDWARPITGDGPPAAGEF